MNNRVDFKILSKSAKTNNTKIFSSHVNDLVYLPRINEIINLYVKGTSYRLKICRVEYDIYSGISGGDVSVYCKVLSKKERSSF